MCYVPRVCSAYAFFGRPFDFVPLWCKPPAPLALSDAVPSAGSGATAAGAATSAGSSVIGTAAQSTAAVVANYVAAAGRSSLAAQAESRATPAAATRATSATRATAAAGVVQRPPAPDVPMPAQRPPAPEVPTSEADRKALARATELDRKRAEAAQIAADLAMAKALMVPD